MDSWPLGQDLNPGPQEYKATHLNVTFSGIHNIQWQILIQRSGLAKGYTMPLCTTPLDLTSGSGLTTDNVIRFSDTYNTNTHTELECNLLLTPTRENQRLHNPEYQLFGLECMCVSLDC
jgi:hypothetical protein